MQATPAIVRGGTRSAAGALLFVFAAAVLLLGGAGGYWLRGLSLAPASHVVITQPAGGSTVVTHSAKNNERLRQRLIDANSFDGSLPTRPAPADSAPAGDW